MVVTVQLTAYEQALAIRLDAEWQEFVTVVKRATDDVTGCAGLSGGLARRGIRNLRAFYGVPDGLI